MSTKRRDTSLVARPQRRGDAERLPRGRHGLTREEVSTSQRTRLMDAMAELAAEKGYANVTIGDLVARGGLAKRTFYDYFPDKDACALAGAEHFAEKILATIIRPHDRELDLYSRVQASVNRMLEVFAQHPTYSRTFLVEIWATGPKVIARRLDVDRQIARLLVALSQDVSAHRPEARAIEEAHALAVVGAVNETLYRVVFLEGAENLPRHADKLIRVVSGLLMAQMPTTPDRRPPRSRRGQDSGAKK
ncbi:TetR/AcrR family transcriptional regulator [Pendulispora rubella]|uniref:TetR/AcrR family transcriptional regulator n=1 Tax=Pendulispora rubella TaxID=2741070 RepID=A0ABZ2L7D9_9BACT